MSTVHVGPVQAKFEGIGPEPSARPAVDITSGRERSASVDAVSSGSMTPTVTSGEDWADIDLAGLGLDSDEEDGQDDLLYVTQHCRLPVIELTVSFSAAIDKVEREFRPVNTQLLEFSKQGSSPQLRKIRRRLLVQIGDHVKGILHRKRVSKADVAWWREELWSYVSTFFPYTDERTFEPHQIEAMYKKFKNMEERRARRKHETAS